jgi:hypothetical protein
MLHVNDVNNADNDVTIVMNLHEFGPHMCNNKRAAYIAHLESDAQYVASATCRCVAFSEHPAKLLYKLT